MFNNLRHVTASQSRSHTFSLAPALLRDCRRRPTNSEFTLTRAEMPSSDYSNAVGGGLKLKGAGGVDKKKKKKKAKKPEENETQQDIREEGKDDDDGQSTALQKALAEEEERDGKSSEAAEEVREYGKTEAQRRFEERRKKRVSVRDPLIGEGGIFC